MNRAFPKPQLTPYEADYALWCEQQGKLLRAGRFAEIDSENVAEEIESLGRSDRFEIESRLGKLLLHLLKWRYQPSGQGGSWRGSIREQRLRIARRLKESPSLKNYPSEVLEDEYSSAREMAAGETGLDPSIFPETCPFSVEEILDPTFFPEA